MQRFSSLEFFSKELPPVCEYQTNALVSLREALVYVRHKIEHLDRYIDWAFLQCHHPSGEGLTRDESAAIYLYTMDWGATSLYCLLNKDLRAKDRRVLKPWNRFLKLINTAFSKLPSVKTSVWRGVNIDVAKNYKRGTEITWWTINSCSKSPHVIGKFIEPSVKSTVLLIEAKNLKDISKYSCLPEEEEMILCLGTKLRVKSDVLDQPLLNIVHLLEITGENESKNDHSSSDTDSEPSPVNYFPPSAKPFHDNNQTDVVHYNAKKKISYPNGATFIGESVDGVPQGKGVFTCPSGYRYEGEFKDGKKCGKGTSTFPDGGYYHGDFFNENPHGNGILTRPDGFRYDGQFIKGKRQGKGTCIYPNGGQFTGDFANGHPNGRGNYSHPSGYRYQGEFKNGKQHGQGRSVFPNGGEYHGNFVDGLSEGFGSLKRPDGYRYKGQFVRGKRHGKGQCDCPGGARYSGDFSNGYAHGFGEYIFPNGVKYEGRFVKGKSTPTNNSHQTNIQMTDGDHDNDYTSFYPFS